MYLHGKNVNIIRSGFIRRKEKVMISKEILVQNNSDYNLCVNDFILKRGDSLILSNAEVLHIYMKENIFLNELLNVYEVFFSRLLYFLLRIKDPEGVKFIKNTGINGLLYYYRRNMYVCPKCNSIVVYDAKEDSLSDVEIYEDGHKLDFMIDPSKNDFVDTTKMIQKHTKIYMFVLAFLTLLLIFSSLYLIYCNPEIVIILLITALPLGIFLCKGLCVLKERMNMVNALYCYLNQNNKCVLNDVTLNKIKAFIDSYNAK